MPGKQQNYFRSKKHNLWKKVKNPPMLSMNKDMVDPEVHKMHL